MKKVYECPQEKKGELKKILEAEPYAEKSFARIGYKLKDGKVLGEDENKVYLYISAEEEFIKFADEKLKEVATAAPADVSERIIKKLEEEEASAESGLGTIFG